RYETSRPGETREPRITGYIARNDVRVSDAPIDQVGAMIDAAVAAGANRVGGLQFSFAKQDELLRSALEKAGADARAQARRAAEGRRLRHDGRPSSSRPAAHGGDDARGSARGADADRARRGDRVGDAAGHLRDRVSSWFDTARASGSSCTRTGT